MGKIVVAGSINMDVVARTPRHPRPGETLFGSDLKYIPGGKGSNQAVAASRLSEGVVLVGRLGEDAFGNALMDFLRGENLDLTHVSRTATAPSGVAIIVVDDQSENTIVVISGANFEVSPDDVRQVQFTADDVALAPFEIPQPTIAALFTAARAAGARTLLNPAPAAPFIDGLLDLVDVLIVNETELAFFAGREEVPSEESELKALAEALRTRSDQTIILTLGARGALCLSTDGWLHVPGREVKAVDTTGAGDCFTGALAVALFEGRPLAEAVNFANAAASLSVQKLGASDSLPYRADVDAVLPS